MRRRRFGWLGIFGIFEIFDRFRRTRTYIWEGERARPLTWAELAYGLLLWLYPPSLRSAYGYDMLQAFRDTVRDERRRRGLRGAVWAWTLTLGDAAMSLPREWRRELRHGWRDIRQGRRSGVTRRVRLPGGGWRVEGWISSEPVRGRFRPPPFPPEIEAEFARRATMRDQFDKFTERARKVLSLAQEEAQRFSHNYIGTEHLLLGLIREEEGIGAKALTNLGVELEKVRSAVEFIIGRGVHTTLSDIGLTPRSKRVIELAVDEARRLGHHYVGTEHLLLGLVREGEGIAAGVLESLGVTMERARLSVMELIAAHPGATPTAAGGPASEPAISVITLVCRDVAATQAFYVDYLDATPLPQATTETSVWLRLRPAGPVIGLRAAEPASAAASPTGAGAVELSLFVRDVEALWNDLRQRGAPGLSEISGLPPGAFPHSPHMRAFTLTDPDGRVLRFHGA
jgi:catechol 2,3-dioxygenase-like lactoylglutathione lyase family enzyme